MKKFFSSFIFKLIVGIIIGAIIGLICRWNSEDVLLVNVPQFAISFISIIPKTIDVTMLDGTSMQVKIDNPQKALQIQGDIVPGENIDLKIKGINFNFKDLYTKIFQKNELFYFIS